MTKNYRCTMTTKHICKKIYDTYNHFQVNWKVKNVISEFDRRWNTPLKYKVLKH